MAKRQSNELKTGNSYFDGISTSHIYAHFKNGVFIDSDTKEAVKLEDGAYVRITVSNSRVPKEIANYHIEREPWTVDAGKQFYFEMQIDRNYFRFIVVTEDPILFKQDGHKPAKLVIRECTVVAKQDRYGEKSFQFEPIKAKSFNEAFRLTSIRFRSNTSSHSCNVYRDFRDVKMGRTLDGWRDLPVTKTA